MVGERLTSLQRTVELLIAAKPASYALSLISFHSGAEVLIESETDPVRLAAAVSALRAHGGTNLQAGFLALQEVSMRHPLDAVILLTDGGVTAGTVTTARGLVSLLESVLPGKPPVHAIGYGTDCNRDLLMAIARSTRSLYMYADAAETLPAVVGDVLAGLQAEIGKQATLHFPTEGIECLEPGTSTPGLYTVGTLIAEKEQWVLFRVAAAAAAAATAGATAAPVPMTLRYRGSEGVPCEVPVSTVPTLCVVEIACQMARIDCAKGFDEIHEWMATGRRAEALEKAKALLALLDGSRAAERPMVLVLKAQVSELIEQLDLARQIVLGSEPPHLPALLSRLASNTAALSNQRGFVSRMASGESDTSHAFSSPSQQVTQRSLTLSYSASDPEAHESTPERAIPPPPPFLGATLKRC
jgi:hypothetical protein